MVKCADPWAQLAGLSAGTGTGGGFSLPEFSARSRFTSMLVNKLKAFSEIPVAVAVPPNIVTKPLPSIPASLVKVQEGSSSTSVLKKLIGKNPKNEIPLIRPRLYIPQSERFD